MSEKENPPQEVLDICRRPYARVLIPDEDTDRWSAFVLELPGCFAEGDTSEEAATNIENAMIAWVWATVDQGQRIAEPRLDSDYSGKFLVRTSRSLHRQIAAYAAIEGTSMNQFIATSMALEVGRKTKGETNE